jgi:6-pyruvoyltetrahydropterin/6-carboxytetrahydropterin synthase
MSLVYQSVKTYPHSIGLSCCFRQHGAQSHCAKLHGYALQVTITFEARDLDDNFWVVDFGGMKGVRQWLIDNFDHKLLAAADDPELDTIRLMHDRHLCDLLIVDHVGVESFARRIFDYVDAWLYTQALDGRVMLRRVDVDEHDGNRASIVRKD